MTKLAFLGTPRSAVPALRALAEIADMRAVITRPDKAVGRSRRLEPPPVKQAAIELDLPVSQPGDHDGLEEALNASGPLDLAVLVAFGMLIRRRVLAIPRLGFVNAHFSLLPRWRGALPVERTIMAGDPIAGITLIAMDEGLDTGPVLSRSTVEMPPTITGGELTDLLSHEAARALAEAIPDAGELIAGATPQDEDDATTAPRLRRSEAHLDFQRPADELERVVRALNPRPGAYGRHQGQRLKIWRATVNAVHHLEVGELAKLDHAVVVGCGHDALDLVEVQPEGRTTMEGTSWARGRRGALGRLT